MSQRQFLDGACPTCGGNGAIRMVNPAWLRERREAAGLSLRDVGAAMGWSAVYISDIERGRRAVPAKLHDYYLTLQARKPPAGANDTAFRYAIEDGVGVYYWIDDNCAYALSGTLDRAQLLAIGRLVYSELAPEKK